MTIRDIFACLGKMFMAFLVAGFLGTIFGAAFTSDSLLAASSLILFQWSVRVAVLYLFVSLTLFTIWGAVQLLVSSNIFYVDGARRGLYRRSYTNSDEYGSIHSATLGLPEPRYNNLKWLEGEISEVLDNEGATYGPLDQGRD